MQHAAEFLRKDGSQGKTESASRKKGLSLVVKLNCKLHFTSGTFLEYLIYQKTAAIFCFCFFTAEMGKLNVV